MRKNQRSRHTFLNKLVGAGAPLTASPSILSAAHVLKQETILSTNKIAANETIQLAIIGAGLMGTEDTNAALKVPGVNLVAASDLYHCRLKRAKVVWGKDILPQRITAKYWKKRH